MLRVRSTKWVFKAETCQANVYLIIVPPEKHFLRCNWSVLSLLWQHKKLVSSCATIKLTDNNEKGRPVLFKKKVSLYLLHYVPHVPIVQTKVMLF